jgi:threonine dehydrogenase-like Zn-dependent dehydrogenase
VRARGIEVIDLTEHEGELGDVIRDMTDGRGTDSVVDAVGMEAHGSPGAEAMHKSIGLIPDFLAEKMMKTGSVDRMHAIYLAIDIVRRGGTISLSGVYGGEKDPFPLLTMFDKQIQLRMGQANVKRWVPEILPLVLDQDVLGVEQFATHKLPLSEAPDAYETFQKKEDGMIKVLLQP